MQRFRMAISLKKVLLIALIAILVYYILGIFRDNSIDKDALKGKNVIITGASMGIGEQMAYWYSRHGANVFLSARREGLLQKVVAKCSELGGPAVKAGYRVSDMGREEDRERFIQEAQDFFGDADQLLLNHAMYSPVDVWTGSKDQVDKLQQIINVNLMGYVHLTALALPSLTKTRGSVGVVGSLMGRFTSPYILEYIASKFAIDGFFSGLRHEFNTRKQNVSITLVTLGVVATDSARKALDNLSSLSKKPHLVEKYWEYAADTMDAAEEIASATTRRQGELYYPNSQLLWPHVVIRSIWPHFPEYMNIY